MFERRPRGRPMSRLRAVCYLMPPVALFVGAARHALAARRDSSRALCAHALCRTHAPESALRRVTPRLLMVHRCRRSSAPFALSEEAVSMLQLPASGTRFICRVRCLHMAAAEAARRAPWQI